ncbi:MAG TPA: formylglycine-generating enzyme family protein [Chitinophagaceae bacterium]|nr:formylglycine-generating enzyme family protein [Chitinophagaceae bacterium]
MKLFIIILFSIVVVTSCSSHQDNIETSSNEYLNLNNNKEFLQETQVYPDTSKMVLVKGGKFIPLYGKKNSPIQIEDFYMDVYPVTNKQFALFTKLNPLWRRSKVKAIYCDKNYLSNWENDTTLSAGQNPDAPVTNISWFAALAYCKWVGKQLPTVDQWEYAAMADANSADSRKEKSYNQYILSWYEKPNTFNSPVGHTFKNYWGIWDMHGLVWEWTKDFNMVMISGESRRDVSDDENKFCGSSSAGASDLMNYAAFMRYAFRGSIKANYALRNLGFRCIKKAK